MIKVERVCPDAILPKKQREGDAGWDLYAYLDRPIQIEPGTLCLIPTGVKIDVGSNRYGRIAPRSGLALNYGIDVLAGVLDSGYRDQVKVILINLGRQTVEIKPGDRIAQLIVTMCDTETYVEECRLDSTERGEAGFGSTGV